MSLWSCKIDYDIVIQKTVLHAIYWIGGQILYKKLNSQNQSAFPRKLVIDEYALNVDIAPVKELISLQRRCVNNLLQIAKHAQAHNVYIEKKSFPHFPIDKCG